MLTLSWDWLYDVNGTRRRSPLCANVFAEIEREVLDSLPVPIARYVPQATLHGRDTVRFTAEVLPLLRGHPSVVLDIDGELWDQPVSVHPGNGLVDELGAITGIGRVEPELHGWVVATRPP